MAHEEFDGYECCNCHGRMYMGDYICYNKRHSVFLCLSCKKTLVNNKDQVDTHQGSYLDKLFNPRHASVKTIMIGGMSTEASGYVKASKKWIQQDEQEKDQT